MSKNVIYLFLGLFLFAGLFASPAQAELGLAGMSAAEVGQAVKTATEAVYAGTDDPEQIQSQLVAILNEAAATGDESAMTYAIVAVMMVGGVENIDLSKEAINNSELFANYPELAAEIVVAAEKLIRSGGGAGELGGEKLGGGEGGGEDPRSLGGGDPEMFDPDVIDDDRPATRI